MISLLGSEKNKTYPLQYMVQVVEHIANYDVNILFNYFENGLDEPTVFSMETIDSTLFQAFSELLRMTADPNRRAEALRIVQAIKCLNHF